jgi:hypothetical protein
MRIYVALANLFALACSQTLAHPPYTPQPQTALLEVTLPQPPGRIETVPDRPSRSSVWVDGEWTWRRARWAWQPGRWVEPPAAASFSPSVFERGPDGRLWYAPGTWRDANGLPVAAPPPLASAIVASVEVVNASGAIEGTGRTLQHSSVPRP